MNCPNILVTYKEWLERNLKNGATQEELDKVWLDTLFSKRSGNRLELLKKITDPKGNEEYSNVVAVQYNGADKSNSVRLLDVKPLDNGNFQVFIENGSYEFEEGKVKSEKTYKGQYIVMPAMSLTKGYELDSDESIEVVSPAVNADGIVLRNKAADLGIRELPEKFGKKVIGIYTKSGVLAATLKYSVTTINSLLKENDLKTYKNVEDPKRGSRKMIGIDMLETEEEYTSNGYAEALLDAFIQNNIQHEMFLWAYAMDNDTKQDKLEKFYQRKGFKAFDVGDDYGTYMYRPKHTPLTDIGAKGTKLLHVSNVGSITRLIGAGDEYIDKKRGESKASWLGTHIGTYDVVKDYAEQMYSNSDKFVYEIEVAKDLNIVQLPDKGDGDWTADTTMKHLKLLHPEVEITEDTSNAELRKILTDLGYDAVGYANSGEGRKSGNIDSLIILNPDSVIITDKHEVKQNEDIDAYLSKLNVVHGNKASSAKIDWSKFNRIENTIHGNVGKMQELLEELHKLGGEKESAEHLDYLKDLIGKMNPKFFKKMKTYIDNKAKSTGGIMTSTKVGITISKADKLAGNQQSEAEVYTHEVVHSYVAFALEAARNGNVEARKLLVELQYTMKVARENMSWRNFKPEASIDEALEKKNAEEMFDYIFNSEHAEDEFIAHVLTNPQVMKRAKEIMLKGEEGKTLWDKVKNLFSTLLDLVAGSYEFSDRKKNVYDMTMDLTFRLAEYNSKALREAKSRESLLDVTTNAFNEFDSRLGEKLEEFASKWMPKGTVPPKPDSKAAQIKWYADVMSKMVLNPTYRKQLSKWAQAFGMTPEGTIQTVMRDFTEQDDLSKSVDWIALQSDRIDGAKMSLIAAMSDAVINGFKKVVSKADRKALTKVVLDTDLAAIYDKYSNAELRAMLTSDEELSKKVSRAKHRLKELDEKMYNWYTFQASGLGRYIATGEAHIAQNFSAMNIARGLLTREYKSPNKKLVQAIDEVATLVALQYTGKTEKAAVAQLLKSDRKGVTNIVEIAKNLKLEASKTVFKDGTTHMMKGYSKEVFDDRISMEVATLADKAEMAKKGFKLVKKLEKHSGDTSGTEFGMYVSNMFSTSEFYRTSTRLTKLQSKGTSLKELAYASGDTYANIKHKTNKLKLDKARAELVTKAMNGEVDLDSLEYGLTPVLNEDGSVVDYRYVINKSAKEDFLGMDTDVATVLGRTKGHTFDKYESAEHNEKLLSVLKKDAEENYVPGMTTGKNDEIYILISPTSSDEKIKDLWDVLPKSFKEEAMNNVEKGLPVRRDLMNAYFGYRHLSIVDFPGLDKITPTIIKSLIKIAETLWMEFIKISKVDILIKMPFVMVGNIISNFMYAIMTGSNPIELLKMYVTSTRDVREYLRKHKELITLQVARDSGNTRKLDISKIAQLERELANNPVHELYKLGVYQAIVEDVSSADLTSTNKLKQMYKDKTEKVPKIIKDGVNWMYLTEETQYYKFMTEVLQMSDLVARDVENRKLKAVRDKQASGQMKLPKWFLKEYPGGLKRELSGRQLKEFIEKSDAMRLDTVLNAFVNYNKPSGSLEEYLNKVGLIMFTKYAKRIQRVIGSTGAKYPIKSLLVLLGQEFIMDVETIQDQSVFTRSWYNMGLSADDLIPGKDLFSYVMEIFTPPVFQGSTYKLL